MHELVHVVFAVPGSTYVPNIWNRALGPVTSVLGTLTPGCLGYQLQRSKLRLCRALDPPRAVMQTHGPFCSLCLRRLLLLLDVPLTLVLRDQGAGQVKTM